MTGWDGAFGGDEWQRRKACGGIEKKCETISPVGCAFDTSGRSLRCVGRCGSTRETGYPSGRSACGSVDRVVGNMVDAVWMLENSTLYGSTR